MFAIELYVCELSLFYLFDYLNQLFADGSVEGFWGVFFEYVLDFLSGSYPDVFGSPSSNSLG